MVPRLAQLLTAAPTPEASRAVGQASTLILVVALIGIVVLCASVLLLLRHRARLHDARRGQAEDTGPSDAWLESAKRVALEDDDEIPREPGTA